MTCGTPRWHLRIPRSVDRRSSVAAAALISCFSLGVFSPARAQSFTVSTSTPAPSATGVARDTNGDFYLPLVYNHTIARVTPNGVLTTIAGSTSGFGSVDGIGANARFNNPRAIALDAAGNLYVADSGNQVIRKINRDRVVTTLAGRAGIRGHVDGPGAQAEFDSPQGIAVDSSGNVYVADTGTRTIRKITPAGVVSTLAGLAYVSGAVDATGLDARFHLPQGVTVDSSGNVFVADTGNHAIRRITPAGAVATFAGSNTNRGFVDGTGSHARFDGPQAVTVDSSGNLFVADTNNYTLRKITPAGVVTTIAGQPSSGGSSNGLGSAARFQQPRGIAVDIGGVVYIADSFGIRVATPTSQLAITVPPVAQSVSGGSTARLTVTATGAAPLTYQWNKDGAPIAGATTSVLTLATVQPADTGTYSVTVTNPVGTLTSPAAAITVLSPLLNDNFANAQNLSGATGQTSGFTNGATGELSEPTHISPDSTASSVWYRWTAPSTGTALFDVSGSSTIVAAYSGNALESLARISSGNRATFVATAGTTYLLAVGSTYSGSRGNFSLTWRMIANDAFAQAQPISGASGRFTGNNNGATAEPDEPVHLQGTSAASTSVWYRWTAPQTGTLIIESVNTPGNTVVGLYSGATLRTLTLVNSTSLAGGLPRLVANVNAGVTYSIVVGSYGYSSGDFTLAWRTEQTPVIIAHPSGGAVRVGGSLALSSQVTSAAAFSYQWSREGVAIPGATNSFYSINNAQPPDAGAYTLTATNSFGSVTSNPAVVTVIIPPPNDNFANAQTLSGLSGSATGSNTHASGEPGEPLHWNSAGTASSVWYRWTPSTSGLAAIDTVGSRFDTVLAVYTGTALDTLTRITQDDDRGGARTSQVTFAADGGRTYHIAVGGSTSGARGELALGWQLSPALAIATAPVNQTVAAGGSATFSVQATGTGITYQWRRNGEIIPGATNATLTVGSVQTGADASYTVTITNSSGSVTSQPATLAVAAPSLTNLTTRHSRTGGPLLWGIAAGGGQMVAVGNAGMILSSSDQGRTWTPRNSGISHWIVGVTYGADQFVAVADAGVILTSPDGVTWTPAPSTGTTQRMNNVIYADDKFVAVGEGGTILTSADARTWTPRISGVTSWLHGLAYNPTIRHFVATGADGVILYSADAATWTRLPVTGLTVHVEAVVAVNSYADFVAIGHGGVSVSIRRNQLVLKSGEPLVVWDGEINATGTNANLVGFAAGAGALFATGSGGKVITASSDRGPWYTLPAGTEGILLGGLFHNDTLYIVGENETILQSDPLYSGRLVNISTRGQVGTGANLMISGFVVTGDRPKQVLVRAAGPTLASSFGVTGTLTNPVLTLVDSQARTIATNTGWANNSNATTIASTAARVGAFPFPSSSADSALLATLTPGAYTALISGANNTTGVSIVEVYDIDAISNEGSRAINISTRGVAGTGANKMIAGFVIDGASSRRVLIRAVGPTLGNAPFNVGGTLAEPQLELYNGRNLLHASAGNWGLQPNADEIRGAAKTVGAFDLPDGSRDSAMVVTLQPGAWTVQVGGTGNSSGIVLVEVYALP